jgi:hypothetical protein
MWNDCTWSSMLDAEARGRLGLEQDHAVAQVAPKPKRNWHIGVPTAVKRRAHGAQDAHLQHAVMHSLIRHCLHDIQSVVATHAFSSFQWD